MKNFLRITLLLACVVMGFGCALSVGLAQETGGDQAPATATDDNTLVETSDAELLAVLDRMEKAADDHRGLTCNVHYQVRQLIKENPDDPDSVQNYYGEITFGQVAGRTMSRIFFNRQDDGKHVNRDRIWYIFDGQWLTEAKELTQTVIRRQMAEPGESADVFRLGKGPFPLPFGQRKDDMLREFDIKLMSPPSDKNDEKIDTKNTAQLLCVPKPGSSYDGVYGEICLHISTADDDTSGLPILIDAKAIKDATQNTARFSKLRRLDKLSMDDFSLDPVTNGWEEIIEPLSKSAATP